MGDQMAELGAVDHEPGHQAVGDRSATRERRRRDLEAHLQEQDAPAVSGSLPQTSSPSSLMRSRRRAFRPSERLQRYQRERLAQSGRGTASETRVSPPHLSPSWQEQSISDRGDRPRAKRRKLDDGTYEEEPRTFSYGDKGQVVSGELKLDIISCDGGEYSDPHTPINSYPQNVLQDDTTVYCTKSNRCNLLLKHIGGMPFTLTKIVVKAPRSGYDAPIQEGLVFIAMEDDALLERTSQYDMRWSAPHYRHERRRGDRYRPSHDYMNSARSPLRSIDRSRYLSSPTYPEDDPLLETHLVPGFQVTVADPSDEEEAADGPPSPRPWHDDEYSLRSYVDRYRPVYLGDEGNNGRPWTNSSDSEGSERDIPRETRGPSERERFHRQQRDLENTLAHRNRMLDLMRAQQIRESDEFFGRHGRDHDQELSYLRRPVFGRTGSRAATIAIGALDPVRSPDDQSNATTPFETPASKPIPNRAESSSSAKGDVIVPHARFFISRSKSSTAIKFDPPVSGRYILVKLWAQCPNANIDIQAILAHGYGGPRFFPALEMR
ncbi:hypothetical protein G647_05053 [Cladophialophora carrionii CBS 160.54]|uniref:Uncharacterized protein n=1 Tax=Cladophialophora carrionii CBS 160.54 TaxID=1279043 RepID=V9D8K4_9EURO|nr:uncharacterized protein G647_05053 [Cladophialophora carrionii CBS 160.54]ETI23254.1 hypothetical protein G647_05053 [Cladophialophora carrionii CBS 160.54]